jgi:hypothetical protein
VNRNVTYLVLFATLLAGARFASSPARDSSTVRAEVKTSPSQKESAEESSCEAFDDASVKNQSSSENDIDSLVEKYLYGVSGKTRLAPNTLPAGITLLVVTVPDPIHTHLSLQFDRTLEALQQALQDEKFTYDSSWLPWKKLASDGQSSTSQKDEDAHAVSREHCPGLILFRRNMGASRIDRLKCPVAGAEQPSTPYDCGLFAFVVAETPTAGLNQAQWLNALSWIRKYTRRDRPDRALRILGPTFSGSMPSIVRALTNVQADDGSFTSLMLYSGRIRGCGSWAWLNENLKKPDMLPARTADFVENDAIQINRFYRFLAERGHSLSEVAMLSEDETAYGGLPDARSPTMTPSGTSFVSPGPECEPLYDQSDRPVHLYYPRDISAIRSAYQEQSLFSTGSSADTSKESHTVLQPQYEAGTHVATDSIEPFSGQGMALTQEAQLYGIVNSLRSHTIRFVILRSTNSLDYLFLTRFLHRAYPDLFIVTMGSDLLFGREVDSTEFRGIVALTTFPLLPRGQDWTKQISKLPQHAHRVFDSDIMEGVYLAARFLTTDYGRGNDPACENGSPHNPAVDCRNSVHPPKEDIPDYAKPFWDRDPAQETPSTWLSVIGREGYWPLAVLDAPYKKLELQGVNLAQVKKPAEPITATPEYRTSGFSLSSAWKFVCSLSMLMFAMHFVASHSGRRSQDLGVFIQFTRSPGNRQLFIMTAGWAVLCCLLLLLFFASARLYPWLRHGDQVWVWLSGGFALAGCSVFVLDMGPWRKKRLQGKTLPGQQDRSHHLIWTAIALVFIAVSIVAGLLVFEYAKPNGVLVAYRSVHLTSGISPMASLLMILGGFYWWFWQALSGLALMGPGRPILPRRSEVSNGLCRVSCAMAKGIEAAAVPIPSIRQQHKWFYLLPLLILVVQACVLQRPWSEGFDSILHSLENKSFNWTFQILLAISGYLVMLDCCQLLITWFALKRLLLGLNRLPLRRTFAALQGVSAHSLWSMSGTSSRARYAMFSHQVESLTHLRNELSSFGGRKSGTPALRDAVGQTIVDGTRFIEDRCEGAELAIFNDEDAYGIQRVFCRCTERVVNDLLVPAWSAERESLDLAEAKDADKQKEHLPLSDEPSVKLGEEFVCLVYVGYLQNILARMRTMVLSMAGIFAAVALSVAFYPYTPRPLIALSLMLVLAVLGVVVAFVYAGLDRDSTLSHITNTTPGSLGIAFWIRIASFVGVPALGLIVAQFPEITDFVVSWVQPSMSAMK